ncbi:uncharacterized protein LOC133199082 [Saccostrea echinata]|uniref:uncharacterized protein LOC133199082 n=1 Tax=Saccostrea echinata TaxID=191078 RepID=UPI002A818436|nr:uncharacterized protein LOC133199082 [Saccostrea echinata]
MLRLTVFLVLASFASCCQRKNDIMTCEMMPESSERMEGVRILIVDRVFGETVDLRSFELAKIMINAGFGRVASDPGRVHHDDPRGNGSDNLRHSLDNRRRNIVPRDLQYCSVHLCSARLQEMRTEKTTTECSLYCGSALGPEAPVPTRHQREPTPVLRRSQRVRRVPERLGY